MKPRLMEIIVCPECLGNLRVEILEKDRYGHVASGLLLCDSCRLIYPVYEGVPRLFPYYLKDYSTFIENNRIGIARFPGYAFPSGPVVKGEESTQRAFSKEWDETDYNGVLWNYTYDQLKQLFLWEIDMQPSDLEGKLILDCGCGNGLFADFISTHRAEAVGFDLSLGVVSAHEKFINSHNVHFVQGSLFKPPFRPRTFDVVYSHGVMHHTYDTKTAFMSIAPLCRNDGRYYVWLYGEYQGMYRLFHITTNLLRFVVSRLPSSPQDAVVGILARLYGYMRRNFRRYMTESPGVEYDRAQTLHVTRDRFTPLYAHLHNAPEVKRWFQEAGYSKIVFRPHLFDNPKYQGGIAIYGDMFEQPGQQIT